MTDLRILSFNTQGLQGINKRIDVFEYLKDKNFHIYCLQDTHFTQNDEERIRNQWGKNCVFSNYRSNARGVAILFGKNVEFKIHDQITDENGNLLILDITILNQRLTLINLYGPNNDSPNFFQSISDYIDRINNSDFIICGDYNCVLDPKLDSYNYKFVNNPKNRNQIIETMRNKNLIDPFRENYPSLKRYTWRKKNPLKQARLDYFLISENIMPFVRKSSIETGYRSDHSIVTLELNITEITHGKSYWKHNNSLLTDHEYLKVINKQISDIKKQYAVPVYNLEELDNIPNKEIQFTINDQLFLDVLLMEIRGKSISYSSYKQKDRHNKEKNLIESITKLEHNLEEEDTELLENLKSQLADLRQEKLKGHIIRSRAQHIDKGEKPTKYFCGLEQHNYVSKMINKIENEGQIITDQKEILKETELFYKKLYTSVDENDENIDIEKYIDQNDVIKLTDTESDSLEGLLNFNEISNTLYNMKNDKSPGLSGYSAEFFKTFWRQLGYFVLRSINFGYIKGELSITQRQGIITCIPKENKAKQFLKNWRPLTLLDTVYKIASGTIANRLKLVLDTIISKDQTGFLKGRYIGENTRLVYDLLKYTEENDIPGLLLLIDFEKAFDSLSWAFIHKALKFLNFGESVRKWIEVFYTGITSAVIQCGHLSSFFQISRGCRQGDPLSPYIFIICAEFLANKIRKNKAIKGIVINDVECKISQFADDTTVFLDGSDESLNQTLEELENFAKISGLKINFEKTQLVWIGRKRFDTTSIKTKWKLAWGKQTFKLLGINFSTDLTNMMKQNYATKIQHLETMVKQWEKRNMTPLGRITIIKTLMIPIFNHLFLTLPNPEQSTVDHINGILYSFLWKNGTKIKNSLVVKQYFEGGLKMVNLSAFIDALKTTWLRRLLLTDSKWQIFIKSEIDISKLTCCNTEYIKDKIKHMKNKFWVEVLHALIKINEHIILTEDTILKCQIFYNNDIKIAGQTVYYDKWFKRGVRYVNDMVKDNGDFYSQEEFIQQTGIHVNYLNYYGIVQAVKGYIKKAKVNLRHKEQNPFIPSSISPLVQSKQGAQVMYNILNNNKEIPTAKSTWNRIYNFTEYEWRKIYLHPFIITKYSVLQWFQISINHNILVTNKLLKYMKIKDDALCTFCKLEEETISHLLWKCIKTQEFIKELITWLKSFNIRCHLSEKLFLFGIEKEQKMTKILMFLLLYAKYYIYCTRCNKQSLLLGVFKKKLLFMYKIHRDIAYSKNEIENFSEEWRVYENLLNDIQD